CIFLLLFLFLFILPISSLLVHKYIYLPQTWDAPLHLRLTQLYLGYLVREHCGLEGIQKNNAEGKQESKNQSDASNTHSVKPQSKSPKSR
ncbi:hypothetical protein, partial [Pseudanabaena cinerea]|uniref:hypothetical protein n=1 Tax=Pseudanabaena cinerea TaxID=2661616 RepID=UPI001A7F0696